MGPNEGEVIMRRTFFRQRMPTFLQFRSTTYSDTDQQNPRWLLILRWMLFKWWGIFAALVVGNYLPGSVLVLFQTGWSGFVNYLTSWGLLAPLERSQPVLFGVLLTIFV